MQKADQNTVSSYRSLILPLALGQLINCSYATTNMNVAIISIAEDLETMERDRKQDIDGRD